MRIVLTLIILIMSSVAQAQTGVGDDINALIDQFFGSGQDPAEELSDAEVLPSDVSLEEVRQSIQLEETILESFNAEVLEREATLWDLKGQKNGLQQQIETLDQQISLDQEKIQTYRTQSEKWERILTQITEQRSLLNAALRAEKTEYQALMAQQYIRAQNLGSDDKVAWWEWLFSPRSVSQILESRGQRKRILDQKQNSLKTLEQLKLELEARERQASLVYSYSTNLAGQLATGKQKLSTLIEARARLLDEIARNTDSEETALLTAQTQRRDSTQYLVALRDQLRTLPAALENLTAPVIDETADREVSLLEWPLKIPIRITANFRDEAYLEAFDRAHDGLDIFAPQGTSIYAPANGVVEKVAVNGYGYTYVILAHKNNLYTVYGHLSEVLVEEGEVVYIGKEIAKSGGTPGTPGAGYFTTGPHLHFEVFREGQFFDPLDFLPRL